MREATPEGAPAPLWKRIFSLLYDTLLLVAVLWCAALPLQLIEAGLEAPHARHLFQAYLVLVSAVYFVWQWVRGGQTLAMKTWRLRLVTASGGPITLRHALVRYVAALAGISLGGFAIVWALFDRDRQFLHDRLAGTRIVGAA